MRQTIAVAAAFSLLLSGCTSRSSSIPASYVSPTQYSSYSCEQLASQAQVISARTSELSKKQDTQRTVDGVAIGVGAVIFWPALLFLATPGHDKEIGQLKGQSIAIQEAAAQKNCGGLATATGQGAAASATAGAEGTGSPPQGGTTTLLQEQGKFDAWYAGNQEALRTAVNRVARDEGLLSGCAANAAPTRPVSIGQVEVTGVQADGQVANITYTKQGDGAGCQETRTDSFLLRIVNDVLLAVDYLGPATAKG